MNKEQHTDASQQERIEQLYEFYVPPGQQPERLDVYLTHVLPNATRTKVQKAIEEHAILVNGKPTKPSRRIQPGDYILCRIYKPPPIELIPEPIPLDIVYEDSDILVVNKPAGMVTHPGIGHRRGTLVNAVLHHLGIREAQPIEVNEELPEEYIFASPQIRPGIVHRLDKDTSGLLLISKMPRFHAHLSKQFETKTARRHYLALVWGTLPAEGTIEGAIGRSSRDRKKFAVVEPESGKYALTLYRTLEQFAIASLVELQLKTGRTHQIRVHLSFIGHPVIGDPTYGGDKPRRIATAHQKHLALQLLALLQRQALHAYRLEFIHPRTGEWMEFEAPLPEDMQRALSLLRLSEANPTA